MRVLVTGATGFVGRAVCAECMRRGWEVRAALRTPERQADLPQGCAASVTGDLAGAADWAVALGGIDAVVHLAAKVHELDTTGRSDAMYDVVNHRATARLAQDAARAGVRRLVFLSTIKVNGEGTTEGRPFRATDAPRPQDAYARSKRDAEDALRRVSSESSLETVVIRPPLVYGPGVGANFRRLLRLVARGVPLPLASVRNRRSFVYVDNLAHLVATAVAMPGAAGRTLLAADGPALSTPALVREIGRALARPARMFPVPVVMLRLAGALTGRSATITRLVDSLEIDAAEDLIGWKPPFDMPAGLRTTADWYRDVWGPEASRP